MQTQTAVRIEAIEKAQCVQLVGAAAVDDERNEPQRFIPSPTRATTTHAGALYLYHHCSAYCAW